MLASVAEFARRVANRWFTLLPGFGGGIEWALSKAFNLPPLPVKVWLAVFAMGLLIAMFLAFDDVRKQRETALSTIASLGDTNRLDDLRRRRDQDDREQERLRDRIEEQKRNEMQRRVNVLRSLRNEYCLSHDGLSPGILAGTEPLPKTWVDAKLAQLGETWRQEVYR
jgi:hypothetical protein